jgi:hypothetical protein
VGQTKYFSFQDLAFQRAFSLNCNSVFKRLLSLPIRRLSNYFYSKEDTVVTTTTRLGMKNET